ncbi:MAG: hypothetical protein P8104_06595 [Gammaproteobacteria bacterium]
MSNNDMAALLSSASTSTAAASNGLTEGAVRATSAVPSSSLYTTSGLYVPPSQDERSDLGVNLEGQEFSGEVSLARLGLQSDSPAMARAVDVVASSTGSARADEAADSVGGYPVTYDGNGDGVITGEEFAKGTAQFLGLYVIPGEMRTEGSKAQSKMVKATAELNAKILSGK